jgi:cell division septation protein DedD
MEQDFAKRRTRTPLAEPDPQPQTSSMGLLFTGLVTGVAVGLFISLLVYMSGVLPPAPGQAAQSVHASVRSSGFATEPIGDATNGNGDQLTVELEREAARLQLEFYQELPNYEVVVDVTPVNVPQPRVITPPAQTASTQAASDSTPAASTSGIEPNGTEPAVALISAAPASSGAFLLQAGAFQQQNTATAQANRLTALGLPARIRQENMPGRTLYLVQAGPYGTREEMMQAERLLRSNNIETMRITLSQP